MITKHQNTYIHLLKQKFKLKIWWKQWENKIITNKEAEAVLLCTPIHGNIGDQALVLADYKFLEKCGFNSDKVLEIPTDLLEGLSNSQIKKIIHNRIVFFQAGGFIGNIWIFEQKQICRCLKLASRNKIIILPQTITFSNDMRGNYEKKQTKRLLKKCKDITLCVRENKSLEVASEIVNLCHIFCVPDMVLGFISNSIKTVERKNNCLFCIRRDLEKKIGDREIQELANRVEHLGYDIKYTDTVIDGYIYPENRERILENKLLEFASAKLVITDRLHGMLFCAITNTPCLFMNNINGKVRNVYEWIKDLDYIKPIKDISNIKNEIINVTTNIENCFKQELYQHEYDALINKIKMIKLPAIQKENIIP